MHILHVTDSLAVGGKERMLVELANQFSDRGLKTSVCVTRADMTLALDLRETIHRFSLGRSRQFDFGAMREFSRYVNAEKADILHAHGRHVFSFLAFMAQLGFLKRPILFHDHYGNIESDARIPFWFKYWAKKYPACYVGVYEKLRDWALRAGIESEKIFIINNALSARRFTDEASCLTRSGVGLPEAARIGIGVGDMRPEKGWHLFIEAAAQSKFLEGVFFVFAGGASNKQYAEKCYALAEHPNLKGRIKFLGQRQDVPALLRLADFAFVPSVSESGPLVLIEHMMSGLPVIYTKVGDIGCRVFETGFFGGIEKPEILLIRNALDALLQKSKEELRTIGHLARELALQQFSIESVIPKWLDLYSRMLGI